VVVTSGAQHLSGVRSRVLDVDRHPGTMWANVVIKVALVLSFAIAIGLSLTYGDTIGDLLLSSTGGLIGSFLAVWWLGPRRET
jgi:hypothetical protein